MPKTTITVIMPIQVPPHTAPRLRILDDIVGGVVVRLRIKKSVDIRHKRGVCHHLKQKRVIAQNVEDARTLSIEVRHTRMGDLILLLFASLCNRPV